MHRLNLPGKTLTVIGLVLDAKYGENESENKFSFRRRGGTLIVCAETLIDQWKHEVSENVERDALSVHIILDKKKEETVESICEYNVVITTYDIIHNARKKNVSANIPYFAS